MKYAQSLVIFAFLFACGWSGITIQAQTNRSVPAKNPVLSDKKIMREVAILIQQSYRGTEELGGAEIKLKKLLEQNPETPLRPILTELLKTVLERRATHIFKVALFYLNKASFESAEMQFNILVNQYPDYSRLDEVLYQLAMIKLQDGRLEEARDDFNKLIARFDGLPRARDASEQIARLSLNH